MGLFNFLKGNKDSDFEKNSHSDEVKLNAINTLLQDDFVHIIDPVFGFIMKDNEFPIQEEVGEYFEERNVRTHLGAGTRLMRGVYVGGAKTYSSGEIQKIDNGNILLTNKRFIFVGKKRTLNVNYQNLISIEALLDGIRINYENRKKASIFTLSSPRTCVKLVRYLSQHTMLQCFTDLVVDNKKVLPQNFRQKTFKKLLSFSEWSEKHTEAKQLFLNNNFRLAASIYEELLDSTSLKSDYFNSAIDLIECYTNLRLYEKALNLIDELIKLKPASDNLSYFKKFILNKIEENDIDERLKKLSSDSDDIQNLIDNS